jgi:hypothetical protein
MCNKEAMKILQITSAFDCKFYSLKVMIEQIESNLCLYKTCFANAISQFPFILFSDPEEK